MSCHQCEFRDENGVRCENRSETLCACGLFCGDHSQEFFDAERMFGSEDGLKIVES